MDEKKYGTIIAIVLFVILAIHNFTLSGRLNSLQEKYDVLSDDYLFLENELESVRSDMLNADYYATVLYLYFDEDDATFDEAKEAYEKLAEIIYRNL